MGPARPLQLCQLAWCWLARIACQPADYSGRTGVTRLAANSRIHFLQATAADRRPARRLFMRPDPGPSLGRSSPFEEETTCEEYGICRRAAPKRCGANPARSGCRGVYIRCRVQPDADEPDLPTQARPPAIPARRPAPAQSWQDFDAHGWNCRHAANAPGVTVCSPPGQPLPVVAIPPAQPPADRPQTVMLKRWRNGVFDANVLLIRPEIYNGQPCESTGAPYTFVSVLGYFECAHTGGK